MVFFSPFHLPVIVERYHAFFISSYLVFLLATLRCNISHETGLALDESYELFHYNQNQRISVQGIISIEVLGESGQVVNGYRFKESAHEHARRLGDSFRFVSNARSVLLKKMHAKKDGVDLTASTIKGLHKEISWEMADMTIEQLMDTLCVKLQDGDTITPS